MLVCTSGRTAICFGDSQPARKTVNTKRKRDPGNSVEYQINSNSEAQEPETRVLPVLDQYRAKPKSYNPAQKRPAPIRKTHVGGTDRAKDSCDRQHRADDQGN